MAPTNLLAVFLLNFSSFYSFVATVAAIICAAFIVVFVVAIAVAFVLRKFTRWTSKVIGVDACALQNMPKSGNYGASEMQRRNCAYHRVPEVPVMTRTTNLLAIFRLHFSSFHGFVATVTAIPRTPSVVIVVVAIAVALVISRPTGLFGFLRARGTAKVRQLQR